jgi:PAS domain S-box-containing protein
MGDACYALDGEWRIVYANRRALAFWRTTEAEVVGQVIWQRFPQLIGTLNEQVLRRVRDEQCTVTFEAPSPTTGIWVSVNVGPSGDGVTVYWRDISERIEAERALRSFADKLECEVAERTRALSDVVDELRRSRARYSAIFENAPVDLVFMAVQPDGRIVCEDANPAWERHSGFTRAYVVGRTLEEIVSADGDRDHAIPPRDRVGAARGKVPARFQLARRVVPSWALGDSGRIEHASGRRRSDRDAWWKRSCGSTEDGGDRTTPGGIAHDCYNLLTAVIRNPNCCRVA